MANFFDQFDEAPQAVAQAPAGAPLAGGNFFDRFDAPAAPQPEQPSALSRGMAYVKDIARSAEAGVDAGVAGVIGAPHALLSLADRYIAAPPAIAIGKAAGIVPKDAPWYGTDSPAADRFPSAEAVSRSMETATGPAYQPQTTAGEIAHTVGEFAPNAAMGGGSALARLGQVVAPALVSEGAGRAARGIAPDLEGPARLVGGLAGGVGAGMASAPRGGAAVMRDALDGIAPEQVQAATTLMEQSRNLPGGGVPLSLDEALNQVTGGQASRASQVARVVANSGGEGQRIAGEFYSARPGQVDAAGRAAFDTVADKPLPFALSAAVNDAARGAVARTPEGMALAEARLAAGPRVTPEQAGQVIQPALRQAYDRREGMRAALADQDYAAARQAPEGVGIPRLLDVERPGEPIVTPQAYSRPQFTDTAPRPLDPPPGRGDGVAAEAGPESLGRFVARNGGLRLDGDVAATDLHKFNVPGLGNVARPTGKGIDDFWRERLIEEGYLRPDADGGMARDVTSELLRKLQNEQRGVPSYPIGSGRPASAGQTAGQMADEYGNALSLANSRLDGDLRGAGIDPGNLHPDVRSRAVGALMRGEHPDGASAYEAVVAGMRPNPAPLSRATTVRETIPDVRFGQVDPLPVIAHVDEQMRTAKGPVLLGLQQARKTLFENDGRTPDLSVAGLHGAREAISDLIDKAPTQAQRVLLGVRGRLDDALRSVPQYESARAGFEAASRNLDPFAPGSAPGRIVAQDPMSGRFTMPAEQVPGALSEGPSAARDFGMVATPEARRAFQGQLTTRLLDAATDAETGAISGKRLRAGIQANEDLLTQHPEVRDRLNAIAAARDGMAAVERSPLGRIAQKPDLKRAIGTLFEREPLAGGEAEIGATMGALARSDPQAARQLARIHLETTFNDATADLRGLPRQYGGAGFASAVAGNSQQAKNLQASIRALPNGDTLWQGLDRFLTTLRATGYRPQKGSDTAFNARIQEELAGGKSIGGAIASTVASAAGGGGVAGFIGAGGAGLLAAKKSAGDAFTRYQIGRNGAAIARMLFDPAALPDLRALVKSAPGSRNADLFTRRLLALTGGAVAPDERRRAIP